MASTLSGVAAGGAGMGATASALVVIDKNSAVVTRLTHEEYGQILDSRQEREQRDGSRVDNPPKNVSGAPTSIKARNNECNSIGLSLAYTSSSEKPIVAAPSSSHSVYERPAGTGNDGAPREDARTGVRRPRSSEKRAKNLSKFSHLVGANTLKRSSATT